MRDTWLWKFQILLLKNGKNRQATFSAPCSQRSLSPPTANSIILIVCHQREIAASQIAYIRLQLTFCNNLRQANGFDFLQLCTWRNFKFDKIPVLFAKSVKSEFVEWGLIDNVACAFLKLNCWKALGEFRISDSLNDNFHQVFWLRHSQIYKRKSTVLFLDSGISGLWRFYKF